MDSRLRPTPPTLLPRNALPHLRQWLHSCALDPLPGSLGGAPPSERARSTRNPAGTDKRGRGGPMGGFVGPCIYARVVDRNGLGSGGRSGRFSAGVRPALIVQGRPPAVLQP